MKRSHFIEKYRITDKLPFSPDSSVMPVTEFVRESNKFILDNFEGLFDIKYDISSYEHIKLGLDYIIYFFKLLAVDVHARTLINVTYSCNNLDFTIKISADGGLPIEKEEMRELIKTARNAGFDTQKTKDGLLLTKPVLTTTALAVYTRVIVAPSIIAKRFAEIFFGN